MSQEPTHTEVAAALERMFSSPCFSRARRAQGVLRFVTNETFAGRAGAINGYSIAINVFGKAHDFDADSDPLVRVELMRLRSRLIEYYTTSGAGEVVRIELMRGSYVPQFRYAEAAAPVSAPSASPNSVIARASPRRPWYSRPAIAGALMCAVFGCGAVWWLVHDAGASHALALMGDQPQTAPRIFVEPFGAAESSETANLAFGISEEILVRLGAYPELQVHVLRSARNDADADFLLSGSVSNLNDTLTVVPVLVDARSGEKIWTATFTGPFSPDSVWDVVDSVARTVAAAAGEPYGPLFDAEVARRIPDTVIDPYHCLLRFVFALQIVSAGAHGRATECFEQVLAADPSSSMSWARLAALYRMEYLHGFNPKPGPRTSLERAADAAQRAIRLDATNAFGHQEMAFLCLLRDDRDGFEAAVARTLELEPSADIRAALGINFIKIGEVERGRALIDSGIADSPRAPPFFFLGYVVDALRREDYNAAYGWARRMATREWPLSQAFLAATAALAGEPKRAAEAAERLQKLRPTFAIGVRDLIVRGRLGSDVESQLARGLELAGVALN